MLAEKMLHQGVLTKKRRENSLNQHDRGYSLGILPLALSRSAPSCSVRMTAVNSACPLRVELAFMPGIYACGKRLPKKSASAAREDTGGFASSALIRRKKVRLMAAAFRP